MLFSVVTGGVPARTQNLMAMVHEAVGGGPLADWLHVTLLPLVGDCPRNDVRALLDAINVVCHDRKVDEDGPVRREDRLRQYLDGDVDVASLYRFLMPCADVRGWLRCDEDRFSAFLAEHGFSARDPNVQELRRCFIFTWILLVRHPDLDRRFREIDRAP